MAAETEERQRKEEELRKRLQEAQEASENGTIQLYKKMAMENAAREAEIAELRYIYYLKYQVYQNCLFVYVFFDKRKVSNSRICGHFIFSLT